MQEEDRKALRSNREALLKDLEPKRVASLLYSREIFSEEDKDSVNAKSTPAEQREEILDILPRKGPNAFSVFCNVLHEVSPHLEELLRHPQEDDEVIDRPGSMAPIPASGVPSVVEEVESPPGPGSHEIGHSSGDHDDILKYKMSTLPRGKAVIINNKNFKRMSKRSGTDIDRDDLYKLFSNLKFDVEVYDDKTKDQIFEIIRKKGKSNHSRYDAFIFAILTHGDEGLVYGIDGGTLSITEITSKFKNNQTLAGKPKIFFFQACQGEEYMDGLEVPDPDVLDAPQQPSRQVSVPVEADFILAHSTVPGYYSWRNKYRGSWFIQSVVEVFNKYYYHMDILQMLTKVCAMVSDYKSENQKALNKRQVPSTVSMLRKGLYFFPEKVTESSNKADDTNPSMTPPKSTCIIS